MNDIMSPKPKIPRKSQIIIEFDYFITTKDFSLIEKEIRQVIAEKLQSVIPYSHFLVIYGNKIVGE